MNQDNDLEKIEKKVYLIYHQDGLWDIFLGIGLLCMGISMLIEAVAYVAILFPILMFSAVGIKKAFTLPRLGYAKFSPQREAKEKKNISKMLILFTFTAIAGLGAFWGYTGYSDLQLFIRDLKLLPLGSVIALSVGVIGGLFGIWRFVLYAVLIFLLFIAGHFLQSDPPAYLIVLGIIFFIIGFIMFIRFMIKFPKQKKNESNHGLR